MILIENLSKKFATPNGEKKVLDGISLSIKDGTLFGISGDSGIGKSTLVSIIAGLQKADGGKVAI
ncbi:MAG: ATP-binding cassette domain-containing protein, partial [Treponema sp.]|nr:ATP-binding cassette domain-containing protein [Treponema sp.]